MTFQDLDVIKSRTLFMKQGLHSGEVLLVDPDGGDMYFTFELRYTAEGSAGSTRFSSRDSHHADVIIDTRPNAITEPSEPIRIGTYGADNKPLYLGFVVQPQIGDTGLHNVIVTFYTGKEVSDGDK
ncbi:MAG: hypothetical protein K2G52_09010 [Muribaculaceae bacterium]|nr:hypothetical protein [Muribaculaceae bacterium]